MTDPQDKLNVVFKSHISVNQQTPTSALLTWFRSTPPTWLNVEPKIAFHADLLDTDLSDFERHFDHALRNKWTVSQLLGSTSHPMTIYWNDEEPAESNKGPHYGYSTITIHVHKRNLAIPGVAYLVSTKISTARRQDTWKPQFMLTIVRYRRTQLRLALYEINESGKYAERIREWLQRRWGDGVKELNVKDAPAAPEYAPQQPQPLLPERATPEQWAKWFDWYYSQIWGYVPDRFAHMESLCGKAVSTIQKAHATYTESRREQQ